MFCSGNLSPLKIPHSDIHCPIDIKKGSLRENRPKSILEGAGSNEKQFRKIERQCPSPTTQVPIGQTDPTFSEFLYVCENPTARCFQQTTHFTANRTQWREVCPK